MKLKAKIFAEEFAMRQILFPGDEQFWYETLRSFDHIAYGGADIGELLVISGQITEGDYDSWHDAYLAARTRALRSGRTAKMRRTAMRGTRR